MFPARAGMSRVVKAGVDTVNDVPRASGDEPPANEATGLCLVCSPRERG